MQPTVFANVRNDMTIARGEIFGPGIVICRTRTAEVIQQANDTVYGLAAYKQSGNGGEYGKWGMEEFLETNAVIGYKAA